MSDFTLFFQHLYLMFADFENLSTSLQVHLGIFATLMSGAIFMCLYNFGRSIHEHIRCTRAAREHAEHHYACESKAARYRSYIGR